MQANDGAAPVGRILAPFDQAVLLELPGQLARGRQREAERRGEPGDRLLALGADLGEQGDVPSSEPGLAVDEREQLARRAAAAPEPAHHAPQ